MVNHLVQFKAGICEVDDSVNPWRVTPKATPGFVYLYKEEDLPHFCWRPRAAPFDDPSDDVLDLIMFPEDGRFDAWNHEMNETVTNGRIYRLSFESSSTRHFFWLQAKSQHSSGKPDYWSDRDLSLGRIVTEILNGNDINASSLFHSAQSHSNDDGDGDTEMQDEGEEDRPPGTGGSGSGATGGGITEEGEEPRQGGTHGARASTTGSRNAGARDQASLAVSNLLRSLQGNSNLGQLGEIHPPQGRVFTSLSDLLQPDITLPVIQSADSETLDRLLTLLPPQLLMLTQGLHGSPPPDCSVITVQQSLHRMRTEERRKLLERVLRSPQFIQSLASLTGAIRDGGLPTICEALKIGVENRGLIRGGIVPLGGGDAVEAFLKGFKKGLEEE